MSMRFAQVLADTLTILKLLEEDTPGIEYCRHTGHVWSFGYCKTDLDMDLFNIRHIRGSK